MPTQPANSTHELSSPCCYTPSSCTRTLANTLTQRPHSRSRSTLRTCSLPASLQTEYQYNTPSRSVARPTAQPHQANFNNTSTKALLDMAQHASSTPKLQHKPYPDSEEIPDCVWECCGCKRRWQTKEMGNVCIGCSHRYAIECCSLAG
jgi:hypothetical protein